MTGWSPIFHLIPIHTIPLQHCPRPDGHGLCGDVADQVGFWGPTRTGAAAGDVAQLRPPAVDAVGDDVSLFLDRHHAGGLDDPASLVTGLKTTSERVLGEVLQRHGKRVVWVKNLLVGMRSQQRDQIVV